MLRRFHGLAIASLLICLGCTPGQGERCNPQRFTDECAQGTSCVYPKNCGVAYCCPSKVTPQSASTCQAGPALDGGTTD